MRVPTTTTGLGSLSSLSIAKSWQATQISKTGFEEEEKEEEGGDREESPDDSRLHQPEGKNGIKIG